MKKFYKAKAFTLIELVFSISLIFIILTLLLRTLTTSISTSETIKRKDDMFSDSYFAINYLYDEISSADYIISNSNEGSLGFTLVKLKGKDKEGLNSKYNYTYYSHKANTLRRHSINTNRKIKSDVINMKMGVNNIMSGIDKIESSYSKDLITIKFIFEENGLGGEKTIKIANRTFEEFK